MMQVMIVKHVRFLRHKAMKYMITVVMLRVLLVAMAAVATLPTLLPTRMLGTLSVVCIVSCSNKSDVHSVLLRWTPIVTIHFSYGCRLIFCLAEVDYLRIMLSW
jgi:hypothetical protein